MDFNFSARKIIPSSSIKVKNIVTQDLCNQKYYFTGTSLSLTITHQDHPRKMISAHTDKIQELQICTSFSQDNCTLSFTSGKSTTHDHHIIQKNPQFITLTYTKSTHSVIVMRIYIYTCISCNHFYCIKTLYNQIHVPVLTNPSSKFQI